MRYQIESEELLIFRDGRPFGEAGTFGGHSLTWPFPQTIAGMVRTAVGQSQSDDYFSCKSPEKDANIAAILKVGIHKLLPMQRAVNSNDEWQGLFPVPADIIFTQSDPLNKQQLIVNQMHFAPLNENCGTDITNTDWLYPIVDIKEKSALNQPYFCHQKFYERYLGLDLSTTQEMTFDAVGINQPITETRIHNALKSDTLSTEDGKLFCNTGFYLKSKAVADNNKQLKELSIHFELENENTLDNGQYYLGGERKQVQISTSKKSYVVPPCSYHKEKWLKVILTTQGDFLSWCPEWLTPDLTAKNIDWVNIPTTDYKVRLRSACVKGWDAVSGWDYVKRHPKATKKLVKAGSVYLLEIKDVEQSEKIAQHLWGRSLSDVGSQSERNGYGQCVIGKATVKEQKYKQSEK